MSLALLLFNISGFVASGLLELTERDGEVQVSDSDDTGILGVDKSQSVEIGKSSDRLVKVTNNLNEEVTVQVRLQTSESWDLYSSGSQVVLDSGESKVYEVDMTGVTSTDSGDYRITVQKSGMNIEVDRSVEFIDPFDETSGPAVVDRIENRGLNSDTCSRDRHVCRDTKAYNLNGVTNPGFAYIESDKTVNNVKLKNSEIGGALVVNAGEEISGLSMDGGTVGGDVILRAHGQNADVDVDLSSGGTIEGDLIIVAEGDIDLSFDSQKTDIKGDLRATVPPGRDFDSSVVNSVQGDVSKKASTDLSDP